MRNTGSIASRHTHGQRRSGQSNCLLLVAGGPLGRRPVVVPSIYEMPKPRIIRIDRKQLRSTGAVLEDEVGTFPRATLVSHRTPSCETDVISSRLGNRYGERFSARGGIDVAYPGQARVDTVTLVGGGVTVLAPLPADRIPIRVGAGLRVGSVIDAVVEDRIGGIGHIVLRVAKIDTDVIVIRLACDRQANGGVLLNSSAVAGYGDGISPCRCAAAHRDGHRRVACTRHRYRVGIEAHCRPRRHSRCRQTDRAVEAAANGGRNRRGPLISLRDTERTWRS